MLKQMAVYVSSSVINRAIPFFLLPILTRYLSPYEYGLVAIFQVVLIFITPLVDLNISQNIARKYFRLSRKQMASYLSTMFLILLSTFGIVLILVSVVTLVTDNVFNIPDRWLMVLPVMALMNMVNKCNLVLLIQDRKPFRYSLFEIGAALINMGVSITLVVGYQFGWEGRATGLLVTSIVMGLIGFGYIWSRGFFARTVDRPAVREILKVSLPTVPHALGIVIIGFGDRLFIGWLVDTSAVGLYDVGYKIGMITMLFGDAFMKAWSPWFFENILSDNPATRRSIVRRSYLFIIALTSLAGVLTLGAHLVFPYFIDEAFAEARQFVIWIALAYAIRGIYQLSQLYLLHEGKMNFLPVSTWAAVVVHVSLNYILIQSYGPIGAAQASVMAFTVMSLGTWWYANRIHPMPWFSFKSLLGGR